MTIRNPAPERGTIQLLIGWNTSRRRPADVPGGADGPGHWGPPRGAEERGHERGEEEHERDEEEDHGEVPRGLLGPERDPGLVVRPRGAVLPGEPGPVLEHALPHLLEFHRAPQWGSATPWIQTRAMWRIMSTVATRGRMKTWSQE